MNRHYLNYLLFRLIAFPLSLLPFSLLHVMGKAAGLLAFYLIPNYRKRALSNLALATKLNLSRKQIVRTAKESFQSLAITCFEYPKLARSSSLKGLTHCTNPSQALTLIEDKKGIVFFCAHQANWELFFLDGTQKMPGVAIGKPIKNRYLYRYIVALREKFGGAMVTPRQALKEGLRALRAGKFFGIVGDQSLPESRYAFNFFGRRAWTTPLPAILAYKTNCPLIVATIVREKKRYVIHYSDPIWPKSDQPLEKEIVRLMESSLQRLEKEITKYPGQWLWQHNRWKQEVANIVYYRFRFDALLIILPSNRTSFENILPHLKTFRLLYPKAFITLLIPTAYRDEVELKEAEYLTYSTPKELFLNDYRFKLVFNFSGEDKLKRHFLRQSAFKVLDKKDLTLLAQKQQASSSDLSEILKEVLSRPNAAWRADAS